MKRGLKGMDQVKMDRAMGYMRMVFFLLVFSLLICRGDASAGLFGSPSVPEGREIKDPEILKLFTPEFNFEWMKIIETDKGKRYVIIEAKEKITKETQKEYERKTLPRKGITIYRYWEPHGDGLLLQSEIRYHKVLSEEPFVVGYSLVKVDWIRGKFTRENVVRRKRKNLIIAIDRDFARKLKPVELYPKEEPVCPEIPVVGSYPGAESRNLACFVGKNKRGVKFIYVTKSKAEDVYEYYNDRLAAHFEEKGFYCPEFGWLTDKLQGMQKDRSEIDRIEMFLDSYLGIARQSEQLKSPPPGGGLLFQIQLNELTIEPAVGTFTYVLVDYATAPDLIKKKIDKGEKRKKHFEELKKRKGWK
jgi:hypothetical protein